MHVKSIMQGMNKLIAALMIAMLTLAMMPVSSAYAATTPATYPTVGANVNGPGTNNWTNPGNVVSNNNQNASVGVNNNAVSEYLQATGYDFSAIPDNATINGISVTIGRYGSTGFGSDIRDRDVMLLRAGVVDGEDKAVTGTDWPGNEAQANYGGPADLWNTTWTPADVKNADFGVALSVTSANNRTAYVDYISITITYTVNQTVTVTTGAGGTVHYPYGTSVNGAVAVPEGSNAVFSMVPNATYIVNDVSVDGTSVGQTNAYTFANISGGHTLSATFDGGWRAPAGSANNNNWNNPANAYTSNNQYATSTTFVGTNTVDFNNFGISIPAGSTIDGIQVAVEGSTTGPQINISVSPDGANFSAPQSMSFTGTDSTNILGSNTDKWGLAWPLSGFTSFTVRVSLSGGSLFTTFSMDQLQVKVHYTRPTALTTTPATGTYGGAVDLSANLTSNGTGVGGQTIEFRLNGTLVGSAITDGTGNAVLPAASLAGINTGNYPAGIEARYAGFTGYAPATATAALTVDQRALTVTATGVNKVYDGNNTATVNLSDDRVTGDTITVSYASALFDNENVGVGKPVDVTGINVTGSDAANYTFNTTAATTADITPRGLTVTATAEDKVYDGNANAAVTLSHNGLVGDDLTLTYTSALFTNKNVGNNKTVTVSGIALGGTDATNYNLLNSTDTDTANITPRALHITATGQDKVYDGTTSATVTLSHDGIAGDGLVLSYGSALFNSPNVGTNKPVSVSAIDLTGADAGNYTFNETTATTANIIARTLHVTATGIDKVYDGTTVATVNLVDDRIPGDNLNVTYTSATFDTKDVGTDKPVTVTGITVTGTSSGNYTYNTETATTADITLRALQLTANPQTKVYGDADPALTYQITGGSLGAGDSLAGALVRDPGETVTGSPYNITQGTLDPGPNYTFTFIGNTLTITPKPASVTPDSFSKIFGEPDPVLTGVLNGFLPADNVTATYSRVPGETVAGSPYLISAVLDPAAVLDNYAITYNTGTLTITTNLPTITVSGGPFLYDGNPHAATVTVTGIGGVPVPGTVSVEYDGVVGAPNNAGTYIVDVTFTSFDPNYGNTFGSGSITIFPATPTVTVSGGPFTYDGTPHAATITVTGIGGTPVTGSAVVTYNGDPTVPSDAGVYTVDVAFTSSDPNYTDATGSGSIIIGQATPTVTVSGGPFSYDGNPHAATVAVTGAGGAPVSGTTVVSYNGDITVPSAVGTYTVDVVFTSSDPNYGNATGSGSITINQAVPTVTITGGPFTYDGNPHAATVSVAGVGGVPVSGTMVVTYNGDTTLPVNVGSYTVDVIFTSSDPNYSDATGSGSIAIGLVIPTITVSGGPFNYDGTPHAATVAVTGVDGAPVSGTTLVTYDGSATVPSDAGTYNVNVSFTSSDPNYGDATGSGSITILQREITVSAVTDNKAYDGNTSSTAVPVISVGTLATGDTANFIQTFDTPDIGAGKTLTPSGVVQDGNGGNNYSVTFNSSDTGAITGITVTVTGITASNKVYDGTTNAVLNTGSASLVGVIPGDDVQLNATGATGTFDTKHVGNGKTVSVTNLSLTGADAGNYGIVPYTTTANITTRPITVTAQTDTKVYDSTTNSSVVPAISVGNLATGDTANFFQAFSTPTVGTSKLLVPNGDANDGNGGGNYLVTFVNNTTGVVTARPVTVTADPKSKAYGDPDPALTYSITGGSMVGGDSLSGNLTRVAGESVGTYAILQGSLSAGPNYNLTYVGANLTISNVNQTITVITHAPADAAYNTSFNVAATANSGLPVAITTTGSCTGSGTTTATIIMASGTGACTVHYNQPGNVNFTPALEVLEVTAAARADQTITVNIPAPATAAYNSGFNVTATASSGLPVAYSATGVCTNVGSSYTMSSGTGACSVQFDQAGNANYNPATQVVQTVTAQKANQTISVSTSAPAYAAYNSSFTVAATSSSGLPVTYSASGACSNTDATFTMTGSTGVCTVQYDQAGNNDYNAATQVTQTVNAQRASQTITVTLSAPSSAVNGSNFNVAAAANSGLPVSITTSGFCTGSGSGSATITMTSGTGACTVLYNQAGNGNFNAAPQVSETVNSLKADQTISVTTSAPATAANDASFNVAATASSGLPITITTSGVCTGGGSGSANILMTSGTGTCTVEYNQAGNANFNPAPPVTETVNAQKLDQTITVTKSAPATASVNSYFTVAASASSSLPVTYSASGVCTNVGATFTMTSSVGICTVQYNQPGNANFNAAPQVTEDVVANEGPAITSADNVSFSVGIAGSFDITTTGNPAPAITLAGDLPNGVTFADNGDGTAILSGMPVSGTGGIYDLVITASNGVLPNAIQNFVFTVSPGPIIMNNGLDTVPDTGDGSLEESEVVSVKITQFLVNFSKDVNNPDGNTDSDDVTNPANFILLGDNGDGIQTSSCTGSTGNDLVIPVDSVSFNNNGGTGPFRATVNINGGQPLIDGAYRLIVCGTTSIVDLSGIPLAGNGTLEGTDFVRNFVVLIATGGGGGNGGNGGRGGGTSLNAIAPVTGFAPGRVTDLSGLPVTRYNSLDGIILEIPKLKVRLPVVGVPMKDNTWDVNWLLNQAGWLEGSAFPGYSGNSVLTSHVTLQYGQPGPFAELHKLKTGDKIFVHVLGSLYVYEVKSVDTLSPSNPSILGHEEKPWLTLFTCAEYNEKGSTYSHRLVVKALLVDTLVDTYQPSGR